MAPLRAGLALLALFLAMPGTVFLGQGLGLIPGSYMTGDPKWAWIGGGMLVIALGLGVFALGRWPASRSD